MADPSSAPVGPSRPLALRLLIAFGYFWWEFLIGDTPELFMGGVAAVGVVAALCIDHRVRMAVGFLFPVLVATLLTSSVWMAVRKGR
ncbi:MAG: hypothetical protein ACYCV7_14965 [Acidimicrobiales bacterium]